jgi:hypothetical protein
LLALIPEASPISKDARKVQAKQTFGIGEKKCSAFANILTEKGEIFVHSIARQGSRARLAMLAQSKYWSRIATRMSKYVPLVFRRKRRMLADADILAWIPSSVPWRERMQARAPLVGCAPTFLARIARMKATFPF